MKREMKEKSGNVYREVSGGGAFPPGRTLTGASKQLSSALTSTGRVWKTLWKCMCACAHLHVHARQDQSTSWHQTQTHCSLCISRLPAMSLIFFFLTLPPQVPQTKLSLTSELNMEASSRRGEAKQRAEQTIHLLF